MNSKLENHPKYWVGQEHVLYLKGLAQSLQKGSREFAEDTDRRKDWYKDRAHYFPAIMLVGSLAYLEGELGKGWIKKYGGKNKRELYVLRIVRNAIVHHAGDIGKVSKPYNFNAREGRPADNLAYVRRFVSNLRTGKIKNKDGLAYPQYIHVHRNGHVELNDKAYFHIRRIAQTTLRNAKRM